MIGARGGGHFNAAKVRSRQKSHTFKSLGHAAATIRKIAVRSVRKRKTPSAPGQAPHTQTGHLKKVIRFEVDKARQEARVGPVNRFYPRTIWDLHEFGGVRRLARKAIKAVRHKPGMMGPIRKGRTDRKVSASGRVRKYHYAHAYQRIRLTTAAQAARADRLVAEENKRREAEAQKTAKYEKRPFMGPALDKARPQIPRAWAAGPL